MRDIIDDIFRRDMGLQRVEARQLKGGNVNAVYDITVPGCESFIVRLKKDYLPVYRKEEWAMARAAAAGVPVPKIFAIGQRGDIAYMIAEKISGVEGGDYKGDVVALHKELGRLARLVNSVSVEGYGFSLLPEPTPHFSETWAEVVAKDHENFFGQDALIRLGVLTPQEFARAQEFIVPMAEWRHPPHLSHNDIHPGNAIIRDDGVVYLIDWTLCQGQPAPYYDLGNMAAWAREPEYVAAFLEGYGINAEEWRRIKEDVDRVSLSNLLRATIWAEKELPHKLQAFADRTRGLMKEIFPDIPRRVDAGYHLK